MMGEKNLKIDFEVQKLLKLLMKSENAAIDQFLLHDEINQRHIYRNILIAIEISIEINDEVSFKELSSILALLSDVNIFPNLISCFHFDDNPFKLTNVVIVACKHNRLEILNQIFSDDSSIISDLSTKVDGTFPLPDDKDEESHNAFYYAARSGNTRLLEVLMKKWPLDYFLSHAEELCFLLSKSLNELMLKNVDVATEMKIYIHSFLLDNYFEQVIPTDSTDYSHDDIQESLSVILEYSDLFQTMYKTRESKNMQMFLAKQIALNIMTLKKWLKSTYDRVPWEEMEFHVISFIRYLNNQGSYINCFVTENDFVKYLSNFCECLANETTEINKIGKDVLSKLPEKLKRNNVVSNIISKYPHFEEFFENYEIIRDYESLNIIKKYVDVVTEVNSLENGGKTVIIRALQVLGENFKNTLESPKLSQATNDFLMMFIPNKTITILKFLRDSFSHGFPLSTCKDIEERYGLEFYTFVQKDVKSLSYAVTSVLQKIKFRTFRTLLERICNCKDIGEYKDISRMIRLVYFENDITDILPSNDNTVITVLEKLIADLSEIIKVKTHFEESIFLEIASIINFEKSFLNKSKLELEFYLNTLYGASIPSSILNSYTISEKKKKIKHLLNGINPVMVPESLRRIGYLTNEIFKHILYNEDEQDMSNIYSAVLKIFYITECQGDEIKHLQELKKTFTKTKKITIDNIRKIKNSSTRSYQEILSNDITSLRKIIREHNFTEFNTESFFIYKNDFKIQVEIEMLTLSILSSIEHSKLFLITTQLSNEEGPLLVGKYLRNYLAHGNAVVDILMDSTQSLFLFALKIIKHDIYRKGNFTIKRIKNLSNAKSIVEKLERLFCALSNGSSADVKHWMKEGADIYGKDPDMRTALHFASKSSNINIIKFLIDRGLNPKTKDVNDTNILHIATASGCKDAVSYIIEDLEISVDEKFNYNQTALHIAAENGFFDIVEILLHHKATINVGQFHETPLYKAVINDKAKAADLLLQNVQDINSIRHATGKTLLHVAAGLGLKNMVEYLLSKGADVNSVSDTRVTPLHKSAYAGHVDIITLLISNGAIVNAKDSADNIPLHFAAFNGQSSTAEILLRHGADFNAFNKEKLSPLQRAIMNGHLNVLKSFIEHGASIEDLERRGFPVFEYAIPHNNLELINILIENGMSIYIRDPDGCTPLHQSIKNGSIDISIIIAIRTGEYSFS
ncbi:uncharacterized protein [Parasteatoda tepidariorum]|uniref:uncharacterized protein n=1 Tax=Parasteatoda tepidariorum TaxID=114398 RepID=UPI0039BD2439